MLIPRIDIHQRKGVVIEIDLGDFKEAPAWLVDQLKSISDRLHMGIVLASEPVDRPENQLTEKERRVLDSFAKLEVAWKELREANERFSAANTTAAGC